MTTGRAAPSLHAPRLLDVEDMSAIRHEVLDGENVRQIEVWRRAGAGVWSPAIYAAGQTLELASIGCAISVDELYREAGLELP